MKLKDRVEFILILIIVLDIKKLFSKLSNLSLIIGESNFIIRLRFKLSLKI